MFVNDDVITEGIDEVVSAELGNTDILVVLKLKCILLNVDLAQVQSRPVQYWQQQQQQQQ